MEFNKETKKQCDFQPIFLGGGGSNDRLNAYKKKYSYKRICKCKKKNKYIK